MRRLYLPAPALALLWLAAPGAEAFADSSSSTARDGARADGAVDVIGVYGQGFDFWSKVQELRAGSETPTQVLQLLDSSFDHPEEGIASFTVRYQGVANSGYFGVGADGLVGGVATNRIFPEVQAYTVYTGHVDFGLSKPAPTSHASGWDYRLGSTIGAGQESLVEGSALDLVGQSPNNSAVFYSGLDLGLGYTDQLSDDLRSRYHLSLGPTLFHSDYSDSGTQYTIESDQFNLRWRQENEWTFTLDTPFVPDTDIGVLTVFGQQPTPIGILPRTWDAVHDVQPWPSVGQMVGLGTRVRVYDPDGRVSLLLDGGFYGGYFGSSALLQVFCVQLAAGTYGFEQSSGYRIEESRIAFVSLGGRIAL